MFVCCCKSSIKSCGILQTNQFISAETVADSNVVHQMLEVKATVWQGYIYTHGNKEKNMGKAEPKTSEMKELKSITIILCDNRTGGVIWTLSCCLATLQVWYDGRRGKTELPMSSLG